MDLPGRRPSYLRCANCGNAITKERAEQVGEWRVRTCSAECGIAHAKNVRRMNMRKLRRARREARASNFLHLVNVSDADRAAVIADIEGRTPHD